MSLNKLLIATALMVSVSGLALADSTTPAATPTTASAPAKAAAGKTMGKKHVRHAHKRSHKRMKAAGAEKAGKTEKAKTDAANPKAR
jgi:hypothetical protein